MIISPIINGLACATFFLFYMLYKVRLLQAVQAIHSNERYSICSSGRTISASSLTLEVSSSPELFNMSSLACMSNRSVACVVSGC